MVDISLVAVMGGLCVANGDNNALGFGTACKPSAVPLGATSFKLHDGVDQAVVPLLPGFPYLNTPLPGAGATTANKRFTRLSALPTVPYVPYGPITNLNIQNVNTTTVASSVASSYTQSYSHETGFNLNAVIFTLEASTTNKGHITMTNKVTQSLTNSNTSSSGLLISPPTDYLYPGYTQFAVFQDNLYGTFMFYPVPGS